jgi:CubicO group peptidase (beta-lactamase class C family)
MIRTAYSLFLLVAVVLVVPAFAPAQDQAGFPVATPESQGLSTAALDELANEVRGYLDDELIVGAEILVIKNRHTVLHEVFGWMDREDNKPMGRNTIFNIRSMTKPLTGAAAQILIDEGKLNLEDRVAKYLPGFDNSKSEAITIEQLLTHRSGLPLSILTGLNDYENLYSMANAVGEGGPQFRPGSKFWYSDAGTEVLGAVVEQVSGLFLDQFVTERLLEPLEMGDSFYSTGETDPRWGRVGSLYLGLSSR